VYSSIYIGFMFIWIHLENVDFFVLGLPIEQCRGGVAIGTPHKAL